VTFSNSASRLMLFAAVVVSTATLHAATPVGQKHVYKTIDSIELKLYVTKPKDWQTTDCRPAIVFFHGGGWVGGTPGQFTEHSKYFASRGLVCVQAQYRLLDKKNSDPPTICINDAKSAMRWVRRRSEKLGIDPNRIASGGGSAGGHLAAFVGLAQGVDDPADDIKVSAKSNAMLLFNPVFDNGPKGWGHKRVGRDYKKFSPMHNITKDDPPAIVFLGDQDKLIPVATLESFVKQMKTVGVQADSIVFKGMGHGFFNHGRFKNEPYNRTIIACEKFLANLGWLTGEPTLDTSKK
jgi:acetyl esterase